MTESPPPAALSTRRLLLSPASTADVDDLWALWMHADVRRFLWDDVVITRERAEETVRSCAEHAATGLGLWVVRERGDLAIVGCAGLLPAGEAAQCDPRLTGGVEPLVAIHPAMWRRGYATEALAALVDYAFERLGLQRLVAAVDVPNAASHRLVARMGFTVLGETAGPRYRLRTYELRASAVGVIRPTAGGS